MKKGWAIGLISLVIVVRIAQIIDTSSRYTNRLNWLTTQVDTMRTYPEQRFLLSQKQAPMNWLHYDWAVGYETLMLSAIDGKGQCALYIYPENQNPEELSRIRGKIPAPFDYLNDYYTINKSPYFHVQDTLLIRNLTKYE